jgi:CopG family nickel-responsive transcriptional regulator
MKPPIYVGRPLFKQQNPQHQGGLIVSQKSIILACRIEVSRGETTRFGICMDGQLLESFDRLIERKGYANRPEAIRDLNRTAQVELDWEEEKEGVGTMTLAYNHQVRNFFDKLTKQQHAHHDLIIPTHANCLEVLVVLGKAC